MRLASALLLVTMQGTTWHLPVTITVLKDVPVRATRDGRMERGVLSSGLHDEPFVIPKGKTFEMIAVRGEGGCRIRFATREREISSCPWLDGFRDHETDVFAVQRQ